MRRFPRIGAGQLEAELKKCLAQAGPLTELVNGFDADFWKLVVDRLSIRLRNMKEKREQEYLGMPEVALKCLLARESEIQEVIEFPATCRVLLAKLLDRKAEIQKKIREAGERSKF